MHQDFAKKQRPKKSNRSPRSTQDQRPFSLITFLTGVLTGGFLTFFAALLNQEPSPINEQKPIAEPKKIVEEMQWDFYEIFPKSVVPIVEEYTDTGRKKVLENSMWEIQVGSFKDPQDADERRATLILIGLNPVIRKVRVAGQQWHRVVVGPFESQLERNRAQDKLAQAEISSIPIKISPN